MKKSEEDNETVEFFGQTVLKLSSLNYLKADIQFKNGSLEKASFEITPVDNPSNEIVLQAQLQLIN